MTYSDFNRAFSKRLRYYLQRDGMTQKELASKLGVGTTSVYNWINGIKSPRMDKVDMMCKIFGCTRSDLVEDPADEEVGYYFDEETARLAQEIYDNKDLGFLMSASRKMSPEDLRALKTMAEALIRKERNWDDT